MNLLPLYLLALLTAPPDAPCPARASGLGPLYRGVAVQLELLGGSAAQFYFAAPPQFADDVRAMRRRWLDLKDAPRLADAPWLPESEECWEAKSFNRRYLQHLECRLLACPSWRYAELDWLAEAKRETEQLWQVWDMAQDARGGSWSDLAYRRRRLKELREALGAEDYYAGRMPPCVPVWRFQPMR